MVDRWRFKLEGVFFQAQPRRNPNDCASTPLCALRRRQRQPRTAAGDEHTSRRRDRFAKLFGQSQVLDSDAVAGCAHDADFQGLLSLRFESLRGHCRLAIPSVGRLNTVGRVPTLLIAAAHTAMTADSGNHRTKNGGSRETHGANRDNRQRAWRTNRASGFAADFDLGSTRCDVGLGGAGGGGSTIGEGVLCGVKVRK